MKNKNIFIVYEAGVTIEIRRGDVGTVENTGALIMKRLHNHMYAVTASRVSFCKTRRAYLFADFVLVECSVSLTRQSYVFCNVFK